IQGGIPARRFSSVTIKRTQANVFSQYLGEKLGSSTKFYPTACHSFRIKKIISFEKDFQNSDFRNLYNWEEYVYRGKPYAFHMQGSKEKKDMAREGKAVKEFIEKIISNQQQ